MIDWRDLDAAILKTIGSGITTFTSIAHRVEEQAKPHAERVTAAKSLRKPVQPWRIVDRRLQALRRQRMVKFSGKEWRLPPPAAESSPQEKP